MANYKCGEQTYTDILTSAKKLFYQKGYTHTYCTEITDAIGVNSGLIHYYFKSKGKIALQVLASVYNNLRDIVKTNFAQLPFWTKIVLETELFWILIRKDKFFCRFLAEIAEAHIPSELDLEGSIEYMNDISRNSDTEFSMDQIRLIEKLALTMEYELINSYAKGNYQISGDEFMHRDARIFLQLFQVSEETINNSIKDAEEILSHWKLEISEDMEIICSPM